MIEYKTILFEAVAELEEKKSRFIASCKPIKNEGDAILFIDAIKSRYWDARHNVYCYTVGMNNEICRFSDDGEPSGTAGMPILEVVKRMEIKDIVVVVTRYFGGILLGASGLVRAYSKSAACGIEASQIVYKRLCLEYSIIVEYSFWGKIQRLFDCENYTVKEIVYEQDIEILVYVPVHKEGIFLKQLIEITNAQVLYEKKEEKFITVSTDGKYISDE